jgi:hypothetical protein
LSALSLDDQDFFNAALNWLRWKNVYECPKDILLPILSDQNLFKRFYTEYSVLRYEKSEHKESLRKGLEKDINALTGIISVEKVAEGWQKLYGLKGRHVSFATKVLTFRNAAQYIPMDRFSKIGLHKLDCLGIGDEYSSYKQRFFALKHRYKAELFALREKYQGFEVLDIIAFDNRILDCALMRIGGR